MPPAGKEICLTELETELMGVFVKRVILTDKDCVDSLLTLVSKLMGNYANRNN